MSVFTDILYALFGPTKQQTAVNIDAMLADRAANFPQRLDWQNSIVDLMKLLGLDSGLSNRQQLARELGYKGALDGSAAMNMWLHETVMRRLKESGGKV